MTPYELGILVHYYGHARDHDDISRNPPIWRPTIDAFIEDRMLAVDQCPGMVYSLTDRGRAYIDAVLSVPLPEMRWIVKWPTDEITNENAILHRRETR